MLQTLKERDPLSMLCSAGILLAALFVFWPLMDVIILSFSLAVVLIPIQRKVSSRIRQGYAAFLICISIVVGILLLMWFAISTIVGNIGYINFFSSQMANKLTSINLLDAFSENIKILSDMQSVGNLLTENFINGLFTNVLQLLTGCIGDFLAASPSFLIRTFLFFLMLYLFLLNGDKMIKEISSLLSKRTNISLDRISKTTVDTMYSVYIVNVEAAIITFFLAVPFFTILGYGHVFFWATMCGLFQLIPFLGPQVIIVFLLIYELLLGDIRAVVLTVCVGYPLISGFADFYFRPKMMAKKTAIHPVLMMIGIFGGIMLMGALGIVFGPLFVALTVSAYSLIINPLSDTLDSPNDPER